MQASSWGLEDHRFVEVGASCDPPAQSTTVEIPDGGDWTTQWPSSSAFADSVSGRGLSSTLVVASLATLGNRRRCSHRISPPGLERRDLPVEDLPLRLELSDANLAGR